MPEKINVNVEIIRNGKPMRHVASPTVKFVNNDGMPTTKSALNIFDPTTFPIAISCFPFIAALKEITISGILVPIAIAVIAIMPVAIPNISPILITAFMVNSAEI